MATLACIQLPPAIAAAEGASQAGRDARWQAQAALVYDTRTDLTWQRCPYGQRWQPGPDRCTGTAVRITFDDAKKLESQGWRMPRLDELVSIVVKGNTPAIDPLAFPDTPPTYFWATDNRDLDSAWYVLFSDGRINHYFPPRTNRDLVRFVRSGRWKRDAGPQKKGS
jgi:hypothetical protein